MIKMIFVPLENFNPAVLEDYYYCYDNMRHEILVAHIYEDNGGKWAFINGEDVYLPSNPYIYIGEPVEMPDEVYLNMDVRIEKPQ